MLHGAGICSYMKNFWLKLCLLLCCLPSHYLKKMKGRRNEESDVSDVKCVQGICRSLDSQRSYQANDLEKVIQQTGILLSLFTQAELTHLAYMTTDTC